MGILAVQSMASQKIFVVFILPIILSVSLATVVMADVLDKPDRTLQMWPQQSSSHGYDDRTENATKQGVDIIGLEHLYAVDEEIALRVVVKDLSFDCGDLYITIRDGDDDVVVTQKAFFAQCFAADDVDLPVADDFTVTIDSPGSYVVLAEMHSEVDTISALGEFVVE